MVLRNLTPHALMLQDLDGEIFRLDPSGVVARCSQSEQQVDTVVCDGLSFAVTALTLGEVQDLPDPEDGVIFIVSRIVASARPDRQDLLVPGPAIRDDQGRVIGARGLSRV